MKSEVLEQIFLNLLFMDLKQKVQILNNATSSSKANIKKFTNQ
jgi:hypothetical protein